MTTMYRTLGDKSYAVYESVLQGGMDINVIQQVMGSYDTITVVSPGILTKGFNYVHDPDGSGRYFFATDETARRTVNGNRFVTKLETDPLRNMNTRKGIAFTRGNNISHGFFNPMLDRGSTTTGSLEVPLQLDYFSTRAGSSQEGDNRTFNHELVNDFSGNIRDVYDYLVNKSSQWYQYGAQMMATVSPQAGVLSTEVLNNMYAMAKQHVDSPEVALDLPITISIMGTTISFTLRDCYNGVTFNVTEIKNTTNIIVGYKIGQSSFAIPPLVYNPVKDEFYEYESQNHQALYEPFEFDVFKDKMLEGIVASALQLALPDSVFKFPGEISEYSGLNMAVRTFKNSDIWNQFIEKKKTAGAQFSFDAAQNLESYYAMTVPDAGQKDLSVYKNGIESMSLTDMDLNTLLTTNQHGGIVKGQLSGDFTGLSSTDISRVVGAVSNGIRIF